LPDDTPAAEPFFFFPVIVGFIAGGEGRDRVVVCAPRAEQRLSRKQRCRRQRSSRTSELNFEAPGAGRDPLAGSADVSIGIFAPRPRAQINHRICPVSLPEQPRVGISFPLLS
jgi:hypothetical protein